MKIGILSFYPSRKRDKEALMLKKAAIALGHKAVVFRHTNAQLVFDQNHPRVLYRGKKLPSYDVIIPRASKVNNNDLESAIIKQFELMGVPVFNSFSSIVRAKNKLRTLQVLDHLDISIPRTVVVRKMEYINEAIDKVGGVPVIVKTPYGSLGSGVAIVESKRSLYSALDIIWGSSDLILIQEYIKASKGKDIRVIVVNDKVVAAMERRARKGDFRSNIGQGGSGRMVDLSEEEKEISIQATKALKLQYAGVDLIKDKDHTMVMEVNCNPGLKGISEVSPVDIPTEIIKGAVEFASQSKD